MKIRKPKRPPEPRAAALRYARRGFLVVPVHSVGTEGECSCQQRGCSKRGKHPRTRHGYKDATVDTQTITEWWKRWPNANVGIATGRDSGLVVLDVDPKNDGDESFKRLVDKLGPLPKGPVVRSGGGGWHYYFAYPTDRDVPRRCPLPGYGGLDLLSDGGFVIAPPSRHASGRRYFWRKGRGLQVELPSCPEPLIDLASGHRRPARARSNSAGQIPKGERNTFLTSEAGSFRRRGYEGRGLVDLLQAVNRDKCRPPLDEAEVATIASSIDQKPPGLTDKDGKFNRIAVARYAREKLGLRRGEDGRLWRLDDSGVFYRPDGERYLVELVKTETGDAFSRSLRDEVLAWNRDGTIEVSLSQIDADLWPVGNGILDWRQGRFVEPSPEHVFVHQIPVSWNPDARCPRFERFLGEVLPEKIGPFIWEVIGLALYPRNPFDKAVLLLGSGRNGKSTFIRVLEALVGLDNISNLSLHDLGRPFCRADLYGKLVNTCADLDARHIIDTGIFKQLTGGDTIQAERKYKPSFQFRWEGLAMFSANEIPRTRDQTDAWFSRWLILDFERQFSDKDADEGLIQKLTAPSELEGVLVQAVRGLRQLVDRGHFAVPSSLRKVAARYRRDLDSVAGFLEARCRVRGAESSRTNRAELYRAYQTWCLENGRHPHSATSFNKHLKQLHPSLRRSKSRGNRNWKGIELVRRPGRWGARALHSSSGKERKGGSS